MEILIIGILSALIASSGIYIGSMRGVTWIMQRIYNANNNKRKSIYRKVEV